MSAQTSWRGKTSMAEPVILTGAVKAAAGLIAPAFKAVKDELARRDADAKPLSVTDLDAEMNEALDVLAQSATNPGSAAFNAVKGVLSGRPEIFSHPSVRTWLEDARARAEIRAAVYEWVADPEREPQAGPALAHFKPAGTEDATAGHVAFVSAIAFVVVSLSRKLDVGDKLQLRKIDQLGQLIRDQPAIPQHLIDDLAAQETDRIRKTRFLIGGPILDEAKRFAERLTVGDLRGASPALRAAAIALVVRWSSHDAELSEMERLLAISTSLASTPEAVLASAFVEAKRSDWAGGIAKLQPIDSPAKRLVAMQIRARADVEPDPLTWLADAGFTADDLDADGKFFLLAQMQMRAEWAAALELVQGLTESDYLECPALSAAAALVCLASTVTDDLKHLVAGGSFQIDALGFPLDDTPGGLAARRQASSLYGEAQRAAESVGNTKTALHLRNMQLWLDLRDPQTRLEARDRLTTILGDGGADITVVPMALGFGIPIDIPSVERALKRQATLDPKGNDDVAFAHFAIAQAQPSAAEALAYFNLHRELLYAHLNVGGMTNFEVRLLVEAGQSGRAAEVLAGAGNALPPAQVEMLEEVIANGPGRKSVASLEAEYEKSQTVLVLHNLVGALANEGYSDRLLELWRRLIRELKSLDEAEQLIHFLSRNERLSEIDAVLGDVEDLIPGSQVLRAAKAWSDYRQGRFGDAQSRLAELRSERDDPNYRALQVNLIIASGRWPELLSFVDTEWAARESRTTPEILGVAHLAARVKSPRLIDLLVKATEKSPEDPHALITAYSIATEAGLDELAHTGLWLEGAIRTSGDDGPLQSISLQELVDQAPDWNAQTDDVWAKLKAGVVPMALAGSALRRPMIELQLAQMIANRAEDDPRRRGIVPAYSGKRGKIEDDVAKLGLDLTALITLGAIDLIDPVLAKWDVHISHGTLGMLFEQRAKAGFHQPSQIKAAHGLRQALVTGKLAVFVAGATADPKLVAEVGLALANMLTEASAESPEPRFVVRSGPVTKIGSFRNESVDLGAYKGVLCSCEAVIDKLADAGKLTADEERRARLYLKKQETRWEDEPVIADGATLYLDDLSVSYLRTVGVLEKLASAGLKVLISQDEIDQSNALIAMEGRAGEIDVVIERIRAALAEGIVNGRVTVIPLVPREEKQGLPTYETLDLAIKVAAIVCDDRFVNQHRLVETPDGSSAIWTSLDVMDRLVALGGLSDAERLSHRTTLRQSGLALFPVEVDEIVGHVKRATVRDGRLVENGDLRAFRENLALTLMRGWFAPRTEDPWLIGWGEVLIDAMIAQWTDAATDEEAAARSNWLLDCADPRNWSALIGNPESIMAAHGHAWKLSRLTMSVYELPDEPSSKRFEAWLKGKVEALKDREPPSYEWLLDTLRQMMTAYAERDTRFGEA